MSFLHRRHMDHSLSKGVQGDGTSQRCCWITCEVLLCAHKLSHKANVAWYKNFLYILLLEINPINLTFKR